MRVQPSQTVNYCARLRTSERGVPGWLYAPHDLLLPPRELKAPSSPKLALLRLLAARGVVACCSAANTMSHHQIQQPAANLTVKESAKQVAFE